MDDSEKIDPDLARVKEAVAALGEHFDSVQIFATRHEPATHRGTINVCCGEGNYFTRYGQVKEWSIRQDEVARENARDSNTL